ncbi:MAG: heat-inducible transcriptional repressor HrcA [bacterium]
MAKQEMNERKSGILKCVVDEYVLTSRPVGSNRLSQVLGISSASIRNEMYALLRMGYLDQPHTSAGRVPTDLGYRFFVDFLMDSMNEIEVQMELVQKFIGVVHLKLDQLLREVAGILSEMAQCLCFISVPQIKMSEVNKIEITPVSKRCVLLVLVLSNGMVEDTLIELQMDVRNLPLKRITQVLNEHLNGVDIFSLTPEYLEKVFDNVRLKEREVRFSIRRFFDDLITSYSNTCFLGGMHQMLRQPEFREADKLEPVLQAFENAAGELKILKASQRAKGVEITIGNENDVGALSECSVVRGHFQFGDSTLGTIGIVGPRRMRYSRMAGLIRYVTAMLSESLNEFPLS